MTETFYFSRFPENIKERMDVNYNNPAYDIISSFLSKAHYSIIRLGDPKYLKSITKGKTPENLRYVDEGIPFIGSTNIASGFVDMVNAPKIPIKTHKTKLAGSQLRRGNVLITMAGTIGRSAPFIYDDECNANQAIAILDINQTEVEPEFLSRYLNSQLGQLFFRKLVTISSQPNINFEQIKDIRVVLPSKIEEQRLIVSRVQTMEKEASRLEAESEIVAKQAAETLARELKIDIPNETRFFFKSAEEKTISFNVLPDEISDRMHFLFFHPKHVALESMKKEYDIIPLKGACVEPIHRGEQPEYDEAGNVKVIKTANVKNSYIDYDGCLKVSKGFFDRFPTAQARKNDVLVASTGLISMGKVAVHIRDEPIVVDGHISIIRLKQEYDPFFVAYFLISHLGQLQFEKWFSGSSGQIEIQPQDLNQFILPESSDDGVPLAKQKEIAGRITEKLTEARTKIENAKKKWKEAEEAFEQQLYNTQPQIT